jgi:outer membrane protein assembly factor BamE (lipoprotein component of BamABCDE complex)
MKPLMFILSALLLTVLLGGCQTPEEQEQQTNQRRYDAIIKQNQKMIDQNQQKMLNQQNP